ncbi:MAG: Ig-like domain-containing protein [Chloroflexota bacterium]|nr:Ig-like domain-containing protein [Chloroflexota bacterium]
MSKIIRHLSVSVILVSVLLVMFSGLACDVKSPESISVTPTVFEVEQVGDTVQYKATGVYPDGDTEGLTAEVVWTSSDTSVISISKGGLATAVGTGKASVTAILNSSSGVIRSNPVELTVVNDAQDVAPGSVITPIPADHPTRNCSLCHSIAVQGTTQWPSGHGAYSDSSCTLCHQLSTEPTAEDEPSVTPDPPADIPKEHPINNCAFCHDSGYADTPIWPAGHDALPDDSCTLCHSVSTDSSGYSIIPNPPTFRPLEHPENSCTFCHASGLAGSSIWPSELQRT